MGLFSKLFSREGEEPTDAQGQDGQTASGTGDESVTKREESVAGAAPSDGRSATGRVGSSEATAQPVSSDKHAKRSPETANAQNPTASSKKTPALEPPLPAADKNARKDAKQAAPLKPPAAAAAAARPAANSGTNKAEPIKNPLGRTQIGLGRKPTNPGMQVELAGALKSPPPIAPNGSNTGPG
ncbi:MAG TPA: hypothetical protein VHZ95_02235, partial [Polyangiales bacterium]|nr:hypothetical protein [Polyangiales bacterium]